jgi:hypothetical protein
MRRDRVPPSHASMRQFLKRCHMLKTRDCWNSSLISRLYAHPKLILGDIRRARPGRNE